MQTVNKELHDKLPASILAKEEISAIDCIDHLPYFTHRSNNSTWGPMAELFTALGQLLDINIKYAEAESIPVSLAGLTSGRYDIAIGPFADVVERRQYNDFIDFIQDYSALMVKKGNPCHIHTTADLSGKRIAVLTDTIGEQRVRELSRFYLAHGKTGVTITSCPDQVDITLALHSDRVDAYWGPVSMLAWHASLSDGGFELIPIGLEENHPYPKTYQGMVVAKNSPLGPVMQQALQVLVDNGTFRQIMQKWQLESYLLDKIGINLATHCDAPKMEPMQVIMTGEENC